MKATVRDDYDRIQHICHQVELDYKHEIERLRKEIQYLDFRCKIMESERNYYMQIAANNIEISNLTRPIVFSVKEGDIIKYE